MTTTTPPSKPIPPEYSFTTHKTLHTFTVPSTIYTQTHKTTKYLAVGAMPITPTPTGPKILLIKRAATDSLPNLWEIPGGAVDDSDASILHGVARELFEETGLVASSIGPQVGKGYQFLTRSGNVVWKFSFLVEVSDGRGSVVLDPEEHQDWVWAGEGEVRAGMVCEGEGGDGRVLEFTFGEQKEAILKAFEVWKSVQIEEGRGL